jgi:hypothetical protein
MTGSLFHAKRTIVARMMQQVVWIGVKKDLPV